jgi:hypothetical protein
MAEAQIELASEAELIGAALALGAEAVPEWSAHERELVAAVAPPLPFPEVVASLRGQIASNADPLGTAFCELRSPSDFG